MKRNMPISKLRTHQIEENHHGMILLHKSFHKDLFLGPYLSRQIPISCLCLSSF
jgi:hypothetical protein